jgi:hypothetical protein
MLAAVEVHPVLEVGLAWVVVVVVVVAAAVAVCLGL